MEGKNSILMTGCHHYCTGCGACAAICPASCIKMKLNEEGFLAPEMESDKCLHCGKCVTVCYKYAPQKDGETLFPEGKKVYAAKALDKALLRSSTSGGIASILAEEAVRNGYEVCGATYDCKEQYVKHTLVTSADELPSLRRSKYLQSHTHFAFSSFEKGKQYMVFGTPCQIYGVKQIAKQMGMEDSFVLIDLFCKGIPSQFLWESYLRFLRMQRNMGEPTAVNFRDKSVSWHKFCLCVEDAVGNKNSNTVYDDLFLQCFIKNVCFALPCYTCSFRHHESNADLRLGDFWGAKYYPHEDGVSLVVPFTKVGQKWLEKIQHKVWSEENAASIVLESQRFDKLAVYPHREDVISEMRNGVPLNDIYEKYGIDNIMYKKGQQK